MKSYLKTDTDYEKVIEDESGSTAVSLIFSQNNLYFSNLGDAVAILSRLSLKDEPEIVSELHRPTEEKEKERVLAACPGITINSGRIQNGLSISRAFGDYGLKKYSNIHKQFNIEFVNDVVSNVPCIKKLELNDDINFCILSSDGLTDLFTPKFVYFIIFKS